ncbi:hypothetical protein ECA727_18978, partial [Escherichia coli ECA-727]
FIMIRVRSGMMAPQAMLLIQESNTPAAMIFFVFK